ncbi:sodium:sulfate symporter [Planococcus sp. PAMC 21323]|uniref:SLC13 family permease n=1 Tax=Planococcus sp. PAMC 21323 TaxID=1526927 RepID=UPI00056FB33E|nr:SLC13 family permease [Planococcus sp. PAMC 21323]AIY06592.1 sodium:sulfate symporter [Planococcus sp. PAMC 21323]
MVFSKIRFWSLFFLLSLAIIFYMYTDIASTYSLQQQLTLLLLSIAIYFWTLSSLPIAVSSFVLIGLMLLFGVVDEPEEAFTGFLSSALYFILVLSLISAALVSAGIDRVFAHIILKFSRGGFRTILFGLPLLILWMPIFLPSAVARFRILEPIIEELNTRFGFGQESLFRKYCMYLIGMLNQNSTMVVFTGGGFPILAAQLLKDFADTEISWIGWFLRIAPPLWIAMLIISFSVWFYFKKHSDSLEPVNTEVSIEGDEKLPPRFWWIILPFGIMIISWIVLDHQQVPLILAPLLLVGYYGMPVNGLITNKTVRNYDWESFLLIGSSFSLGYIIEKNGTALVLAEQLMNFLPEGLGEFGNLVFIAGFIFLLRFLFVVPSTSMIIIFPIIMNYAQILDLSILASAFLVIMIIGGVTILPIHSPTTFLAFQKNAFSLKEQLIIGSYSSFVIMTIAITWAVFIW